MEMRTFRGESGFLQHGFLREIEANTANLV